MRTDDIDALIKANIESLLVERDLKPTRLSLDAQLSRMCDRFDISGGKNAQSFDYSTLCKIAGAAGVQSSSKDLRSWAIVGKDRKLREECKQILPIYLARLPEDLRHASC